MPLDVNLPTFHLAPRPREPHITTLSYTSNGSSPQVTYNKTLSRDPQNTYSVTLHDAFVPDILYASISAVPEIHPSTATVSPGGTPPDPKILLPAEFSISLFNPDSSILIEHHHSTLRGTYWEFTLPKTSFLPPTASKLDAASSAAVLSHLPRATFRWRKEGGLMTRPQLRCSLVSPANLPTPSGGASTKKAGANEPDIPIAMFTSLGDKRGVGEITIYQSNLKRVEVEDLKGLEVVLLLSAMAIGDIWFLPTNTIFNLNPPIRGGAGGTSRGRKNSFPLANPPLPAVTISVPQPQVSPQPPTTSPQHGKRPAKASFAARFQQQEQSHQRRHSTPGEDGEYARRVREEDARRRALAEQEQQQIRRMLAEEEAREQQRRKEEVDRETERLRRLYERERQEHMARGARNAMPQRAVSQQRPMSQQWAPQQPARQPQQPARQPQQPARQPQQKLATPGSNGTARPLTAGGSGGTSSQGRAGALKAEENKKLNNRKSFLGLKFGGSSEVKEDKEKRKKLLKKGSSMF